MRFLSGFIRVSRLSPILLGVFSISLGVSDDGALRLPDLASLPLRFEEVEVEGGGSIRLTARRPGYQIVLGKTGLEIALVELSSLPNRSHFLSMEFVEPSPQVHLAGLDPVQSSSSYFLGADPTRWRVQKNLFARAIYQNIYPGIDVIFYGNAHRMEWDFVVHPGASAEAIRFRWSVPTKLAADGTLVAALAGAELQQRKPILYQQEGSRKREVEGEYRVFSDGTIGFKIGPYDKTLDLVVDPVLEFSGLTGGSGDDVAIAIDADEQGNIYFAGITSSPEARFDNGWPPGVIPGTTERVGYLIKLDPAAENILYSIYLADDGFLGLDLRDMALDKSSERACLVGSSSQGLPTQNAFQSVPMGNGEGFVTCFNANGDGLLFSTYLGGADFDWVKAATIRNGNLFVAGLTGSADLPETPMNEGFPLVNPIQGPLSGEFSADAFVAIFAFNGTLTFSTLLGGAAWEEPRDLAVDAANRIYLTGDTESDDFPMVNAILDVPPSRFENCFVTQMTTTAILFSTYFGGSNGDFCEAIAVSDDQSIYLTGRANSSDFPIKNALQPEVAGDAVQGFKPTDAFVSRICPNCSGANRLVYSTFLGGRYVDEAQSILVDEAGRVWVGGTTRSGDFPAQQPLKVTSPDHVFQTGDGGANWEAAGLPYPVMRLEKVGSQFYAATPEKGVWRDGPGGWVPFNEGLDDLDGSYYRVNDMSRQGSTLYVATQTQGVMQRGSNSGQWQMLDVAGQTNFDRVSANDAHVYAAAGNQFFRSDDGGMSWTQLTMPQDFFGASALVAARGATMRVYVFSAAHTMLVSNDGGGSWTERSLPVPSQGLGISVADGTSAEQLGSALFVGLNSFNSSPQQGVAVSLDSGASWSPLLRAVGVNAIRVLEGNPDRIYAATDSGLFEGIITALPDNINWRIISGGIPGARVQDLFLESGDPVRITLGIENGEDGFLAQLSADGSELLFSSALGGSGDDSITSLTLASPELLLASGWTESVDFPLARESDDQAALLLDQGAGFPLAFLLSLSLADVVPGDADGDGLLTVADAIQLVRFLLELSNPSGELDFNQDGSVDLADLVLVIDRLQRTEVPDP